MRRVSMLAVFAGVIAAAACGENISPARAADGSASAGWTVDYGASRLGFTATQTGKSFDGRFEKFDAEIIFDPSDLADASIDVAIDTGSAKTGDKQRDTALPGKDWFDVKENPTAAFVSNNIEETGDGEYVAHGALTIRGVTKDLNLPFSLAIDGGAAHATGSATIIRTDFGVGQGEFSTGDWVGLDVTVNVDIRATR